MSYESLELCIINAANMKNGDPNFRVLQEVKKLFEKASSDDKSSLDVTMLSQALAKYDKRFVAGKFGESTDVIDLIMNMVKNASS